MSLKYLFNAEFRDGTVINQTEDDISSLDPKRSQFYDVLEKTKESSLKRFELHGEGKSLIVDLVTGWFDLNGIPFRCHETLPLDDPEFRLIFYREHQAKTNIVNGEPDLKVVDDITGYCVGWQTTIQGKNYKETVIIN